VTTGAKDVTEEVVTSLVVSDADGLVLAGDVVLVAVTVSIVALDTSLTTVVIMGSDDVTFAVSDVEVRMAVDKVVLEVDAD
jgi:hypothetical protein